MDPRFLAYVIVSVIAAVELYFLPLFLAPKLYEPISFLHAHLEKHIFLFSVIMFFFMAKAPELELRETPRIRFILLHVVFAAAFFLFLFYLLSIFPFEPLPRSHPVMRLAALFNARVTQLTIRYRLIFVFLYAACHYSLTSYILRFSGAVRRYIYAALTTFFIAEFFGIFLWKALSIFISKANLAMLSACGLDTVSRFEPGQDPVIGTSLFHVSIAYSCAGLEGIMLFLTVFGLLLFMDWNRINKKRGIAALVAGTLVMIFANILRIYALLLVGHFIDREFALATFHTYAGMIFYTIVIMIYFYLTYNWILDKD
jgi:exosortase/archaeosortase family protein